MFSQKQSYQAADWNNEKAALLQVIFRELIEFINKVDDENEDLINYLEETSVALIKEAGFYSSKAELIENQMIQEINSTSETKTDNASFSARNDALNSAIFLSQSPPQNVEEEVEAFFTVKRF